jgi:putative membrane protein
VADLRKFNLNEIFWFLILGGFYIYICYLLITGRLRYFIHPRMFKYIELSLFALTILAINQFLKVFKNSKKSKVKKGYALFLIPLLLGFIVSPNGLNTSMADKKGYAPETVSSTAVYDSNKKSSEIDYYDNGTITFNDDEYSTILADVSSNYKKYNGKNVEIEGFVFRDKGFKKDEFVAARFLMICCAADTSIVGLMGNWDRAEDLKSGEWVRVNGKIKYTLGYDQYTKEKSMLPTIDVEKVTQIKKPEIEYVYP